MTQERKGAPRGPSWVWGSRRLWIDETANEMLALSSRYVAAMGSSSAFVWKIHDGGLVRSFPGFRRTADAWLDDERELLCLRDGSGRVTVCDLRSGEVSGRAGSLDDPPPSFVSVDRRGYQVEVTWPDAHVTSRHYPQQTIGHTSVAAAVGRMAIPHGRVVDIVDRAGRCVQTFEGHGMATLSPDGRTVALADLARNRLLLGDVATGQLHDADEPVGRVAQLGFSPDGGRLLVNAGHSAWVLDVADRSRSVRLQGCPSPRSVSLDAIDPWQRWSPDGRRLIGSAGHQLASWDAHTGAVHRVVTQDPRLQVEAFSVDAPCRRAATLGFLYPGGLMVVPSEEIVVWDLELGVELARVPRAEDLDAQLELSPDGRTLAILAAGSVRLVSLPGRPGEPAGDAVTMTQERWPGFVPDRLRVRGVDGEFVVQRIRGGVAVEGERAFRGAISCAKAADESVLAVGFDDGRIEVVEAADFSTRARLMASGKVEALALAPRGEVVVAGGWDATVEGFVL